MTCKKQAGLHVLGPCALRNRPLVPAERSAARLAHQSGGLGVPSSNLGAPTIRIKGLNWLVPRPSSQKLSLGRPWEDIGNANGSLLIGPRLVNRGPRNRFAACTAHYALR